MYIHSAATHDLACATLDWTYGVSLFGTLNPCVRHNLYLNLSQSSSSLSCRPSNTSPINEWPFFNFSFSSKWLLVVEAEPKVKDCYFSSNWSHLATCTVACSHAPVNIRKGIGEKTAQLGRQGWRGKGKKPNRRSGEILWAHHCAATCFYNRKKGRTVPFI